MGKQSKVSRGLSDILGEPQSDPTAEIPATGYTRSTSVGLKASEIDLLDDIAAAEGVRRNAVMRYLLRWAMAEYQAGRLAIPTSETRTKRVDMP